MTKRYQMVWKVDETGAQAYSLCEVQLDQLGHLRAWSDAVSIGPQCADPAALITALSVMFADATFWKPVAFDQLEEGMQFGSAE